jgi:hypothetical protein
MPGTPALGRLRQEDLEFEASLGCITSSGRLTARPCHRKRKKERKRQRAKDGKQQ